MRRALRNAIVGSVVTLGLGCSLIANSDLNKGIGEPCSSTDQCQGSTCDPVKKVCASTCTADLNCPTGSRCAAGTCELPFKVGALYVGARDEGWTLTHHEALTAAKGKSPYVQDLLIEDFVAPGTVGVHVDTLVKKGVDVIFANSFSHAKEVEAAAVKYPQVKFLTCSGNIKNASNLGSYFGRMEQAWYVAGNFAARGKKRLGFLGSFITPEVVRHLNAFTLGAKKATPGIVVEVRWLGFWFDYNALAGNRVDCKYGKDKKCTLEEWHTEMLLEAGAEVIAHQMDNGLPVAHVEKWNADGDHALLPAQAIGNDNQFACHNPVKKEAPVLPGCIFSVYWNWTPTYQRLIDDIHYKRWAPGLLNDNIADAPDRSVAWIEPSPNGFRAAEVDTMLKMFSGDAKVSSAFEGPIETTGQRAPLKAGEKPNDAELATMCWAVTGIVEKTDPKDPKSADKPALIPDDKNPPPAGVIPPQGSPVGVGNNCKLNAPVITESAPVAPAKPADAGPAPPAGDAGAGDGGKK